MTQKEIKHSIARQNMVLTFNNYGQFLKDWWGFENKSKKKLQKPANFAEERIHLTFDL